MMKPPPDPVAAVTHPDPYAWYAELARTQPLAWNPDLGAWVAAGAQAVEAVLASTHCRVRPPAEPVPRAIAGTAAGEAFAQWARMNDGAAHSARRPAIEAALGTIDLASVSERADAWTHELWACGGWAGEDGIALGFRLPVLVMAEMLGVPAEHLDDAVRWTGDLVRGIAPGATPGQTALAVDAAPRLTSLVTAAHASGSTPMRALWGDLASGGCPVHAGPANAVALLVQAHDAVAGLLGNASVVLAEHPEVRAELESDPGRIAGFVREVLRLDPPLHNTRRWVAEDAVIAGQPVRAGDAILVVLAAAEHDSSADDEDAPRFGSDRQDRPPFTFGRGIHACPGSAIAVTIAQAAIAALLEMRVDFGALTMGHGYHPSINARIPRFAASAGGVLASQATDFLSQEPA